MKMPPNESPMVPTDGFPAAQHPENSQGLEAFFAQQVQSLQEAFTNTIIKFRGNVEPTLRSVESQRESNELERLRSEQALLENRIWESEMQRSKLQEQNMKLRDIIVRNGNHDSESMDAVIIKSLCKLRDVIQRIVQKHYVMRPARPNVPESIRRYHVQAMMFDILFDKVLTRPCFGLNDETEQRLGEFETALYDSDQAQSAKIDLWKKTTIECAGLLRRENLRPARTAEFSRGYMSPLLASQPEKVPQGASHPTEQYDKSVLQLCEDAYKLSLLMRSCNASYRVEKLEKGRIVDEHLESEIVCQAFEDGEDGEDGNVRGSKIAFTIFGALVKTPDLDLEKQHVLEKAHVICHAG